MTIVAPDFPRLIADNKKALSVTDNALAIPGRTCAVPASTAFAA